MTGRIVLGIDVDKTLTTGGVHWEGEPKPNKMVCDYVSKLYYCGKYVIIIWTARQWDNAPELVGWLTKHSIPFHAIKMDKGAADIYIEDKAQLPTEKNLKNLLENEIKLETW